MGLHRLSQFFVLLALFARLGAQLWSGAQSMTLTDQFESYEDFEFLDIGLFTTATLSVAPSQKVYLMFTANFFATSDTSTMRFVIYRDGMPLTPQPMHVIDATSAGEQYPITFTFVDSPGYMSTFHYSVLVTGVGILSFNGGPRTLFSHVLSQNYPVAGTVNNGEVQVNSLTPITLATTAYSFSVTGGHLVGAHSAYNPTVANVAETGYFSLTRDGVDLGGSQPLAVPNSPLSARRRSASILYFEMLGMPGATTYSSTARLAASGNTAYTVGSMGEESRIITAIAMPPNMGYSSTITTAQNFDTSNWTPVGLTVTVPGSMQASKILVTVNVIARTYTNVITAMGHFTIFRNGMNVGDDFGGLQTVSFIDASTGIQNRECAFFFVDNIAPTSTDLTYSLMFRVGDGNTGVMSVGISGVKSQIATIVAVGTGSSGPVVSTPVSSPVGAPTFAPYAGIPAGGFPGTMPVSAPFGIPTGGMIPGGTPVSSPVAAPTSAAYTTFMTSPTYVVSPGFAFAARSSADGSIWTWGQLTSTSNVLATATNVQASGTSLLAGNRAAYAFLKTDGSVGAFGVSGLIEGSTTFTSAYAYKFGSFVSNEAAFAGISTTGGKVLAFGSYYNGGDVSTNAKCNGYATQLSSGVVSIVASSAAFAALKSDGTVYAWGNKYAGGGVSSETRTDIMNVRTVYATATAFAALLTSGAVKTWGDKFGGGDSSAVSSSLASGVLHIIGSQSVFVAYKQDTSIVVWGNPYYGGAVTSTVVPALTSGVKFVSYTGVALAALKTDGSVVAWGSVNRGGDTSGVSSSLTNIAALYSNRFAFAALTAAGGVVAWGDFENGGLIPSTLASVLSSGVTAIYSTHRAFAALKGATGQLVLWGSAFHGAEAGAAAPYLTSGVRTVCANDAAFTAILQDGRAVAWGHPSSIPTPGLLSGPSFSSFATCATGAVRAGV